MNEVRYFSQRDLLFERKTTGFYQDLEFPFLIVVEGVLNRDSGPEGGNRFVRGKWGRGVNNTGSRDLLTRMTLYKEELISHSYYMGWII